MRITSEIPRIADLSVAEKLELLGELWDNISESADPPVRPGHAAELERRWARYEESPDDVMSLEDLKRKLGRS